MLGRAKLVPIATMREGSCHYTLDTHKQMGAERRDRSPSAADLQLLGRISALDLSEDSTGTAPIDRHLAAAKRGCKRVRFSAPEITDVCELEDAVCKEQDSTTSKCRSKAPGGHFSRTDVLLSPLPEARSPKTNLGTFYAELEKLIQRPSVQRDTEVCSAMQEVAELVQAHQQLLDDTLTTEDAVLRRQHEVCATVYKKLSRRRWKHHAANKRIILEAVSVVSLHIQQVNSRE